MGARPGLIVARDFVLHEDAQRVLDCAAAEAERLHGIGIRSEHILLSLSEVRHERGAQALRAAGVDLDALPDHIVQAIRSRRVPWWMPVWESGLEPDDYSREARRVLRFARIEAGELGHVHVGTEHLLLGILHVERSLGARVLGALGVTLASARDAVRQVDVR